MRCWGECSVAPFAEAMQEVLKESGKDDQRLRQQLGELQRHWSSLGKQEEIEVALIATAAVIFCTLSTTGSSRFTQGHCSRHRKCAACRVGLACTALTEVCRCPSHPPFPDSTHLCPTCFTHWEMHTHPSLEVTSCTERYVRYSAAAAGHTPMPQSCEIEALFATTCRITP